MRSHLVVVLASVLAATACTGSESDGSGGHSGSGSGGANGGGSGGNTGSGGSPLPFGSGGMIGGTGGARPDSGADTTAADSGGGQDTGDGMLHFSVDVAYILRQDCGGCHLSPTVNGNFDMMIMSDLNPGPNAYAAVTGAVSSDHAGCTKLDATKKRVVPGKPDNSLLYIKISTTSPPASCGGHMPMGANAPQNHIDTIKTWIMQGALK